MAKKKVRGLPAFQSWYAEIWDDRWPVLEEALVQPVRHVALWNVWSKAKPSELFSDEHKLSEELDGCWEGPQFLPPSYDQEGLMPYYLLDGASALVSSYLKMVDFTDALDLCAAPGGKSLQLAFQMEATGTIVLNELSKTRFHRLQRVIQDYLPRSVIDGQVKFTKHDAQRWCLYEKDAYDFVLLDAPCSSERHLLHDPKVIADWSPSRSKQLSKRQYAMLASALDVVRVGGHILYMTCSISPLECDGVVERLLKKRKGRCEVRELPLDSMEPTDWGGYLLPDQSGWGPIYSCLIQRTA